VRPTILGLCLTLALTLPAWCGDEECTTAVIAGGATHDGRPILWKNRDTDSPSNKVVYVRETPYAYLAVVDAQYPSGRVAWGGLNERGFAVINSMSYNLPHQGGEYSDLEGLIMAEALRKCATIDDFELYIKANLGPEFGSRANFCVIDAQGGAAIFEVHNHGYRRLNADTTAERYLLNTNFSRSGPADKGLGYLRFDRETELFASQPAGSLSHTFVLQTVARDLGHALLRSPSRADWKSLPAAQPYWVHSNSTINRGITASVILIHGVKKGEDPANATLWVMLGEPVCSIATPLWVGAGDTPPELREGEEAPIAHEAARLKKILRPLNGDDRKEYVDVTRLDNASATGWLPGNLRLEGEILSRCEEFCSRRPSPAERAGFQKDAAARVLARLQAVR